MLIDKVAVAGRDPAIRAFLGRGGLGFQDVDARIESGQSVLELQTSFATLCRVVAIAEPDSRELEPAINAFAARRSARGGLVDAGIKSVAVRLREIGCL